MNHSQRLDEAVAAVCPVRGVDVGTDGDSGSVVVRYAADATDEQKAAAQAVVDGFDWSPEAQAAWELARNRNIALSTSLSRSDDTAISVRAWLNAVIFLVNNRLEALGQPRVQLSEIMGVIQADPAIGDPQ